MSLQQLKQLSPVEQRLRTLWQENPHRHLDRPCAQSEVEDILSMAFQVSGQAFRGVFSTEVAEGTFIPAHLDCSFVPHARYTPVFWHRHTFFELLCVLSGGCENLFQDEALHLTAGDVCIHAPGTVHAVRAFSDGAVLLNILIRRSTFDRSFFGLMESESILSRFFRTAFRQSAPVPFLRFRTGGDLQINALILDAMEVYRQGGRYQRPLLNAMLSEILIRLLRDYEDTIQVSSQWNRSPRQENLMEMLRYAQSHAATVTMQELSERFHYSERQLQRLFRQATGASFREAIQAQRLEQAAKLLRTTDWPVQRVAEECGFQALNNFRKLFQRRYGSLPADWRRQNRTGEEG